MAETILTVRVDKETKSFLQHLCKLHNCVAIMILALLLNIMLISQVKAIDLPKTQGDAYTSSFPSQYRNTHSPKDGADLIVFLNNNAKDIDIIRFQKTLDASVFVRYTEFISKGLTDEETDMDFESSLTLPSIEVKLVPKYINADSIAKIKQRLMRYSIVNDVVSTPYVDDFYQDYEEDEIDEEIEELNEVITEEEQREGFISRFGWDIGQKLADGKLEIGMTKEMCYAIGIDAADYKISRYRGSNGDIIEEWERDLRKLMTDTYKELGFTLDEDYLETIIASIENLADFTYAFSESFSQVYSATSGKKISNNELTSNRFRYKYIKFKNNVIIELRKSGSY